MITRQLIQEQRDAILNIAHRYGAHHVRLFGSVARGDQTGHSDVDLIVRFDPERSLFDHGGLLMALQDLLQAKVDVVDEGGVRPRFRHNIIKDEIPL